MDRLICDFGGKLHLDVQMFGSSSAAINIIKIDDILTQSLTLSHTLMILIFKQKLPNKYDFIRRFDWKYETVDFYCQMEN